MKTNREHIIAIFSFRLDLMGPRFKQRKTIEITRWIFGYLSSNY